MSIASNAVKKSPAERDQMIRLRVAGVPEHFNLPWHLAREEGLFNEAGIDLVWEDFPGGTGAMIRALRAAEVDVAVVLTEGIIRDIAAGNPSSIVQLYVSSPLVWGAHVASDSPFMEAEDLKTARYAISRKGSGSHLMAFVHAERDNRKPDSLEFKKVGSLAGALEQMAAGKTDCLLWEKFTTQPYVDSGQLRRVDEIDTPWPCFVIAVRNQVLFEQQDAIKELCTIIQQRCQAFMASAESVDQVQRRYGFQLEDVQAWFSQTTWATDFSLDAQMLQSVGNTLTRLGLMELSPDPDSLIASPGRLIPATGQQGLETM